MLPSHARKTLLAQHARLRELLTAAERSAAKVLAKQADATVFLAQVGELLVLLEDHNTAEEAILKPMLMSSDVLGPLRANRMFEEHAAEHVAFRIALSGKGADIVDGFADFAEELLAHMEAEERTFLSPAVLRDPAAADSA
jgi:hemerythrin HHE cation binding domain-containing protein